MVGKNSNKSTKIEGVNKKTGSLFMTLMPSLILGACLAGVCIFDVNSSVKKHKMIENLEVQIRDFTVRSTLVNSNLITFGKESNILNEVKKRGIPLLEISVPPHTFKSFE